MKRSALIYLSLLLLPHAAFAIECSRAKTPSERAICGNPILKAYDEFLDKAYSRVRSVARADVFSEVRRSQIQWIRDREIRCNAEVNCMIEAAQERTAVLNGFAQRIADHNDSSKDSSTVAPSTQSSLTSSTPLSAQEVYKRATLSVVVVHAYSSERSGVSQGSGVVLAADVIATNCHVIQGAQKASIFYRGLRYEVVSAGGDAKWDYCVLRSRNLPALPVAMGSISQVSPGQRVYTIGSPRGLELTIAEGIVSGLRPRDGVPFPFIQTSAAISPGSSGGGLFDEYGRVIGITTFLLKDSQSLNFALPVELFNHLERK